MKQYRITIKVHQTNILQDFIIHADEMEPRAGEEIRFKRNGEEVARVIGTLVCWYIIDPERG